MPNETEDANKLKGAVVESQPQSEPPLPVTDPAVAIQNPNITDAERGRAIIARRRAMTGVRRSGNDQDNEALLRIQEEINAERVESRRDDQLLQQLEIDVDSEDILKTALRELATEIHALRFHRERMEREGADISGISNRRVQSIRQLVEAWFKRQEQLSSKKLDLNSPEIQIVLKFFLEKVAEAMDDIGIGDQRGIFFNHLQSLLLGWEVEAEKRIYMAKMESLKTK